MTAQDVIDILRREITRRYNDNVAAGAKEEESERFPAKAMEDSIILEYLNIIQKNLRKKKKVFDKEIIESAANYLDKLANTLKQFKRI